MNEKIKTAIQELVEFNLTIADSRIITIIEIENGVEFIATQKTQWLFGGCSWSESIWRIDQNGNVERSKTNLDWEIVRD